MKVKAIYQGNNEALVPARYGVGEHTYKTSFVIIDVPEVKGDPAKGIAPFAALVRNEPAVGAEIEIEVADAARDDVTLYQEAKYKGSQSAQGEVNPPTPVWPVPRPPRKAKEAVVQDV